MEHYIAIFVEDQFGDWRAIFPDVPGCEAKGFCVDDVMFSATSALRRCLAENGSLPSPPMDMADIPRMEKWLAENHIDLSKAVVSMVPLHA
jgi:predicted RNase H-like HicB family nuclease